MKKILKSRFITTAHVLFGRGLDELTEAEIYKTIATTAKQSISDNWIKTNRQYTQKCVKQIYYFSIEFLLGRLLRSNLINLGIEEAMKEVLQEFNLKLSDAYKEESDAGLGSGGGSLRPRSIRSGHGPRTRAVVEIPDGADAIHIRITRINGNLRASAGLSGYGLQFNDTVADFRDFQLKKPFKQPRVRTGK